MEPWTREGISFALRSGELAGAAAARIAADPAGADRHAEDFRAAVAAGLGATQVVAPRFGRLLTWSLAVAGINDWLQAGFAALTAKANAEG